MLAKSSMITNAKDSLLYIPCQSEGATGIVYHAHVLAAIIWLVAILRGYMLQSTNIYKYLLSALVSLTFLGGWPGSATGADNQANSQSTKPNKPTLNVSRNSASKTRAPERNSSAATATSYIRKAEFEIVGAGCVSCIRQIERLLKSTSGVESAKIEGFSPPKASVVYDMDKTNVKVITDQVKTAGYGVKNQQDSFYRADNRATTKEQDATSSLLKMPELRSPHL